MYKFRDLKFMQNQIWDKNVFLNSPPQKYFISKPYQI